MEGNRRRQNTKRKRTALWKRCIAAAVAMVTVLTGLNYDGLANVFAKETSGYQIDVSYSEDKTSAVLTGNVGNVPTGTTLTAMTGADGTEYDPNSFQMTVTENGTYTYTLKYNVSAAETGQTVEKKETLEVTVNQIAAKQTASKTTQSTETAASGAQSSSQADTSSQSNSTAQQAVTADSTEAPETVPLAELKAELATLADEAKNERPTWPVYQYAAEEKRLSLVDTPIDYEGGMFAENAPEYTESGVKRSFVEASLMVMAGDSGSEAGVTITGLYPKVLESDGSQDVEWYYTTAGSATSDQGYGPVQVGYLLPDNTQVRLYYKAPDNPTYDIVFKTNSMSVTASEYNLAVKNTSLKAVNDKVSAAPTERVMVEFKKPSAVENMTVEIQSGLGKTLASFNTSDPSGSGLTDEGEGNYSGMFIMDSAAASITISGTIYGTPNRWFTAFSSIDVDPSMLSTSYPKSLGMSRTYTLEINGKTVSTPNYQDDGGGSGNVYYDRYGTGTNAAWRLPGYGLKNYLDGGVPYTHTYRISGTRPSDNYTFANSETRRKGDTTSTPGTGLGTVDVKVSNASDSDTFTAPVSNFPAGSKVKVRFETAIQNTDGQAWSVAPNALSVDVYTEQDKFTTREFTRETFTLPGRGQSATYNLETGGKVTIECKTYDGDNIYQNPSESPYRHERRFQDGYMFSTKFITDYSINDYLYTFNGAPSNFSGIVNMSWYAYEVTVEGVYHDFKLYQTTTSGAHRNAILKFDNNAEAAVILEPDKDGEIGTDMSPYENDLRDRSYVYLKMSQVTDPKFQALELPFVFRSFMKPNNADIRLALAIRRGYSPPRVTSDNTAVTVKANGYNYGAYQYIITMAAGDGNPNPSNINVTSTPVEFRAQFYKKGVGRVSGTDIVTLGYGSGQSRNYLIVPPEQVLDEFPNLTHFEAYLVKTDGSVNSTGEIKLRTLNNSTEWHTGDIISYDAIYDQAVAQSFLEQDRSFYRLEIRAVEDATGAAMINGTYQIKQQQSFSNGNSYQGTAFQEIIEGSVRALKSTEVVIVGYKDEIIDNTNHNHFKLGRKSQTSGRLNNPGDVVGQLYYLAAVRASIDASGVKELENQTDALDRIKAWNEANADELYTGANGESNVVDYSELYTYLNDEYDNFRGFQVKNVRTGQVYDNYTLADAAGADLYLIGAGGSGYNANIDIWNALFTGGGESRGQLVLVPTFGAPENKIISVGSTLITKGTDVNTYSEGHNDPYGRNGSFLVEGTFQYTGNRADNQLGQVKWALTRHQTSDNEKTAALLAYGTIDVKNHTAADDDQHGWAEFDTGIVVVGPNTGFTSDSGTEFKLQYRILHDSTKNPITYANQQDAEYTIHAWVEDVGSGEALTSKGNTNYPIQNELETFNIAQPDENVYNTFWNGETSTAADTDIPGYTQAIKVLPQFVASAESPQNGDSTQHLSAAKTIAERQNFNLTADFTYDELYPAELQGLGSSTPQANAQIHTALFRKGAGSTDSWTLWAWDNNLTTVVGSGNNAKVTVNGVTAGNQDKITVSYTVNNVSNSITKEQEEGAQYCIVAWNATNTSFEVSAPNITTYLAPDAGTAYEEVPSVTTTIAVDQNKITPVDDSTMVSTGGSVTTHTNGSADPTVNNGRFQVTGTFKYTGDNMLTEGKLQFAVTKLEHQRDTNGDIIQNPTDGAPSQRYKLVAFGSVITSADGAVSIQNNNKGGQYLDEGKLTLADVTTNPDAGTVTLTFDVISVGNSIQYRWDQDAQYTVHAWSDGNTGPDITALKNMASTSGTSGAAAARHTQIENTFFGSTIDIPGEKHMVKVLPKRIATAGADLHVTAENKAVKAEQNYTLGISFKYDTLYPKSLQDGTDTTTVPEAQIHTAIFKKNPPEKQNQAWELWMWDNTVTSDGKTNAANKPDKVSRGPLGLTDGTLSVTYNLINAPNASGGSSITWEWEDGAQYYIVAWNGSNDPFTVNADNIKINLTPDSSSAAYAVTPSVTTPITLEWQDAQYYVEIPARVILSDDGDYFADGKKSNYAGESAEVTYGTFSDKQAPEIEVKVSDGREMTVGGTGTGDKLTMEIYSADGERRTPTNGYSWLGILRKGASDETSGNIPSQSGGTIPNGLPRGENLPFQINAETSSAPRKTMYQGTLLYDFTLRDWDNPS